ncbi:MAG: hypothetical protein ACK41F_13925 [Fimbriimonadaceae bacterium]
MPDEPWEPTDPQPGPRLWVAAVESTFDDVTNSYKFFWMLALLDEVRRRPGATIPMSALVAGMLAGASRLIPETGGVFGAQDRLPELLERLCLAEGVSPGSDPEEIRAAALRRMETGDRFARQLKSLADFVPYRFLRPFYAAKLAGAYDRSVNGRIAELAEQAFSSDLPPVYRFLAGPEPAVELHPAWREYLLDHGEAIREVVLGRLRGFLGIGPTGVRSSLPEPGLRRPATPMAMVAEDRSAYGAPRTERPADAGRDAERAGSVGSVPAMPWWKRRNGSAAKARRSWLGRLATLFRRLLRR